MSTLRRYWCSCLPGDLVRDEVVYTCPYPGHCVATEVYVVPVGEAEPIPDGWDEAWYRERRLAIPAPEEES